MRWMKLEPIIQSKVNQKVLVTKSCLTLCDPMGCSPLGSSIHGIFQERILERVAISSSMGISKPRDPTWISRRWILYHHHQLNHQGSSDNIIRKMQRKTTKIYQYLRTEVGKDKNN